MELQQRCMPRRVLRSWALRRRTLCRMQQLFDLGEQLVDEEFKAMALLQHSRATMQVVGSLAVVEEATEIQVLDEQLLQAWLRSQLNSLK